MVNDKADWVAVFRQHFKNKSIYAAQPNKYGNSNMKILGIKNWRLNVALIVFFLFLGVPHIRTGCRLPAQVGNRLRKSGILVGSKVFEWWM